MKVKKDKIYAENNQRGYYIVKDILKGTLKGNILKGKKAQFFSLTVFIILLVIIILLSIKANLLKTEDDFNIDRLEKTIMNNFVRDFDRVYLEEIIRTSLKPSVASVLNQSKMTSMDGLLNIMNGTTQGYIDPSLTIPSSLKRVLGTITLSLKNPDDILHVNLIKIEQTQHDEIIFTFVADYKFELYGAVWERTGKQIVIVMDIYDLKHPGYSYRYIDRNNWETDTNASVCFMNQVFVDAPLCSHYNIKPSLTIDMV